jgi:hypothetical protein
MAQPLDLMDYRELQRECKAAGVSAKGCAALRPPAARRSASSTGAEAQQTRPAGSVRSWWSG